MITLFNDLIVSDSALQAQREAAKYLENRGYYCKLEYSVPDAGNGHRGKIDIVATNNVHRLAIEFDNNVPRIKSLFKLKHIKADFKYVLLRGGNKSYVTDDILVQSIRTRST